MSWKSQIVAGALDEPATCCLTYCCPCVTYGMNAEKVHGGECLNHGLKYYLYSCVCLCGLVAGPTRKTIRKTYGLPQQPEFLASNEANSDCLVHTIPCVGCFAHCQEAYELQHRGVATTAPIAPVTFTWAPLDDNAPAAAPAATTTTQAPKQEDAPAK